MCLFCTLLAITTWHPPSLLHTHACGFSTWISQAAHSLPHRQQWKQTLAGILVKFFLFFFIFFPSGAKCKSCALYRVRNPRAGLADNSTCWSLTSAFASNTPENYIHSAPVLTLPTGSLRSVFPLCQDPGILTLQCNAQIFLIILAYVNVHTVADYRLLSP